MLSATPTLTLPSCGFQRATYANGLFKIVANAIQMVLNVSADAVVLLPQAVGKPVLVHLLKMGRGQAREHENKAGKGNGPGAGGATLYSVVRRAPHLVHGPLALNVLCNKLLRGIVGFDLEPTLGQLETIEQPQCTEHLVFEGWETSEARTWGCQATSRAAGRRVPGL